MAAFLALKIDQKLTMGLARSSAQDQLDLVEARILSMKRLAG